MEDTGQTSQGLGARGEKRAASQPLQTTFPISWFTPRIRTSLWILGVPHGHHIATIWSTKTRWIKRNRRISTKTATFLKPKKSSKLSTFTHGFGRGITRKGTMKGSCIHPQSNPKKKGLKSITRNSPRNVYENHQKENGGNNTRSWGTTSNHLYIPWKFIQGLACHPIIHPSLRISPWSSQASPKNPKENRKGNSKNKWARCRCFRPATY
jgi:hypothetical protein